MRKCLLLLFGLMTAIAGFSQKAAMQAGEEGIQFRELGYDFGKISQGRPVLHIFEVINNGQTPLTINHVQASCGCTTPEWSSDPVAPGAVSAITVGFNAASEGQFSKSITVTYNGNLTKTIVISGNVYKTPATSAPLNPALSLIKQINQ